MKDECSGGIWSKRASTSAELAQVEYESCDRSGENVEQR